MQWRLYRIRHGLRAGKPELCTRVGVEHFQCSTQRVEGKMTTHSSYVQAQCKARASTDFYLAFDLKGRMKEYKEQLEVMYCCSSLRGFKPDYFSKMGMHACSGDGHNTEVPVAAFRSCLNLLLSSAAPDYKRAAIIVRKLIMLSDQRNKDGPNVLKLYKEANHILLGLKSGDYPHEEIQWLVSTAWNRAALQIKVTSFAAAEQWLELLNQCSCHGSASTSHDGEPQ